MRLAGWQLCAIIFRFRVSVQSFRIIEHRIALVALNDQSLSMFHSQVILHSSQALVSAMTDDADKVFAWRGLVIHFYC